MVDPEAQQAVNAFIDLAVEKQKKTFHSDLESFDSFSSKLRSEMEKYLHTFHAQFYGGYEVLVATLDKEMQKTDTPSYRIRKEAWQLLQEPDVLFERFQEGKTLQEILGLSFETVLKFYEAACALFEAKRMHEARNALFFLTTISPQIPEFWCAKSSAHLELNEFEEAIDTAEEAYALIPEKADALFSLIRAYIKMGDFDKALLVCDQGLGKAKEYPHLAWAKTLENNLQAAKQYIEQEKEVYYG